MLPVVILSGSIGDMVLGRHPSHKFTSNCFIVGYKVWGDICLISWWGTVRIAQPNIMSNGASCRKFDKYQSSGTG